MKDFVRRLSMCALLALVPCAGKAAVATAPAAEPLWIVSFAGFDALGSRQTAIGKALGNTMLPMWISGLAERRFTQGFGAMRRYDPIRWVAFRGKGKNAEIALVYPSVDKVAKMTLNHPGAERRGRDSLFLPKGEGRPADVFVVFARDFSFCAVAPSEATARMAASRTYPPCEEALFLVDAGGVSGSFDFEENAFVYRSRTSVASNAARLAAVPMLGALVGDGATHRIGFDDLKRLVSGLVGSGKKPDAP